MSDLYSSIVTNDGESTLLQNTVNAYVFKIARVEICSRANLDLTEAMTWKSMEAAKVVYTISKEENLNSMIRKVQLDANTVQFRISLDTTIGGTSEAGMICGSIGVYLQGYDERGEKLSAPFLFAVGSLGSEFIKYADGSNTIGNMVSFYLNLKISNTATIDNILVAPTENYSLPTVDNEKSAYLTDYFNAYVVNNYDNTGLSAIAFKTNKNSENFSFILQKNESTARLSMGGVYDAPELSLSEVDREFKRFAYWTKEGETYAIRLAKDRVLSLANGMGSDGYYRNERYKLSTDVVSNLVADPGDYITVAVLGIDPFDEEAGEKFYIKTVPASYVKTINDKNLNNIEHPTSEEDTYFIFNTLTGHVYETTASKLYTVKVAKLAIFKIDALGNMEYFVQMTGASGSTAFDMNRIQADLNNLRSTFEGDAANLFVKKTASDTISGKYTFTYGGDISWSESIEVHTANPTICLSTTASGAFVGGIIGRDSVNNNISNLYMNGKSIGLVSWSNAAVVAGDNDDYTKGEYLVLNADAQDGGINVVSESENVKNHFIQNTLDKLSVVKITGSSAETGFPHANTVYFDKVLQAPLMRTTSVYTYWADLAENYEADGDYPEGTLIMFGGEKDITIATDSAAAEGVISSNPGLLLNCNCDGYKKPVALVGKVPVRVIGAAHKGDFIYHSSILGVDKPGVACASKRIIGEKILGKVLEDNEDVGEKLVLCVVRLTF